MKSRKNIRSLIQEYNAAAPANKPNTPLAQFVGAVLAMKSMPSRLAPPHTQGNRYDDYVYVHQQSMAGHPNNDPGPHPGHKGPAFFPWHREFLRQFELDLRTVSSNPNICLPYWDFSRDQSIADPGYPFVDACLGGDGTGPNNTVVTGAFTAANGFVVALGGGGVNAIQRLLQQDPLAPSLPSPASITAALAENTYDAPSFDWDAPAASSFRNLVEGWVGPDPVNIHNRVHVWVGGSMGPSTSPNDPVFFLNHAKEDELWAVWSQKYPSVPHYLPNDSYVIPAAQHHLKRLSDHMDSLTEYFGAGTLDRPIDLLDHKAITWYDTDLPEITLTSGPALAFNNAPAGLTAAKMIRFQVKTTRPVFFSVTGAPSGNFSIFGGPDFSVMPVEANDIETLEIEVRFVAIGPNVQVSAVDLQAHIIDAEGYYAASPGASFVVQTFHIELVANNIITSNSSIVLVLDRSGSMADIASSGFSKSRLLKNAVGVVHELMQENDQIGIARFDHEADVLLPMTLKSAGLGSTLTGTGLDPRGATNIAGGILIGSGLINGPSATQPNKAMIVLTDGNDYPVPNTIAGLPPGTISQTTFAIGFGLAGQVNDATLSQISANTGGYLLTTGNMATDDERFLLAKFFIQVLKDATLNQTVVDPAGLLLWHGSAQEIAFQVADSDVSLDVVTLCPIPFALDFRLAMPGGEIITPAMSGVLPNVRYQVGSDIAYYRLLLPALPSRPADSHRGKWRALLSLKDPSSITGKLDTGPLTHGQHTHGQNTHGQNTQYTENLLRLREFARKPTPFNLSVHTYSNLRLDASLSQDGFAPGALLQLHASLWEYGVPLKTPASLWAELIAPDGSRSKLNFAANTTPGSYRSSCRTSLPGIYQFTLHAEGHSSANSRFTREKLLTAGVWAGGERPFDTVGSTTTGGQTGGAACKHSCHAMLCLLEQVMKSPQLNERLKELGFDLRSLHRCLAHHCSEEKPATPTSPAASTTNWQELVQAPEISRLLSALASSNLQHEALLATVKTMPVKRKAKMEGSDENIFIRPGDRDKLRPPPKGKK